MGAGVTIEIPPAGSRASNSVVLGLLDPVPEAFTEPVAFPLLFDSLSVAVGVSVSFASLALVGWFFAVDVGSEDWAESEPGYTLHQRLLLVFFYGLNLLSCRP